MSQCTVCKTDRIWKYHDKGYVKHKGQDYVTIYGVQNRQNHVLPQ